jgi:hypothetical protein
MGLPSADKLDRSLQNIFFVIIFIVCVLPNLPESMITWAAMLRHGKCAIIFVCIKGGLSSHVSRWQLFDFSAVFDRPAARTSVWKSPIYIVKFDQFLVQIHRKVDELL